MSQEITAFKLISGAEVVGRLVSQDDDVIVLEKVKTCSLRYLNCFNSSSIIGCIFGNDRVFNL